MPTSRIKRSAELLGQSWAVLRGDPSLAVFPVVSGIATLALAALGVLTLLAWIVIAATLRAITQMALYRFAVDGQVPNGFDRATMEAAFAKTP